MAVFNGAKYLNEAIESVLNQTYQDFEFIIVDDASTDESVNIINSYNDKRIILLHNQENMKLPRSLNRGIIMANGEYVIRMDADDICMPDRFEKQVEFMDTNLDVAASSGNYYTIDSCGVLKKKMGFIVRSWRLTGNELNKYAFIPSPLVHPAAIIRKSVFDEGILYNTDYASAQDYDLWLNIHRRYKLGNIKDVILKYRVHDKSISVSKKERQLLNAYKIFLKYAERDISFLDFKNVMRFEFSYDPIQFVKKFYYVFPHVDYVFLKSVILYTLKWMLCQNNAKTNNIL